MLQDLYQLMAQHRAVYSNKPPEPPSAPAAVDVPVPVVVTPEMVDRFLSWPLPKTVSVDPCARWPGYPDRVGTNLLTADEARAMLEHVLAAHPASPQEPGDQGGHDGKCAPPATSWGLTVEEGLSAYQMRWLREFIRTARHSTFRHAVECADEFCRRAVK